VNVHTPPITTLPTWFWQSFPLVMRSGVLLLLHRHFPCESAWPVCYQIKNRVYLFTKYNQHRRQSVLRLLWPHMFFWMLYAGIYQQIWLCEENSEILCLIITSPSTSSTRSSLMIVSLPWVTYGGFTSIPPKVLLVRAVGVFCHDNFSETLDLLWARSF